MKKRIFVISLLIIGLMSTLSLVTADSQGVYTLAVEEKCVLTDIGKINLPVGTLLGNIDPSRVDAILMETRLMQTTEGPRVFNVGTKIDIPEPGYPDDCNPS